MHSDIKLSKLLACAGMTALMLAVETQFAYAQAPDPEIAPTEDEIVVTGSRIRRDSNASSAVPLQVFSSVAFDEIGTTDLAEALVEIPGVSESISPENSNNLIQTSGLSTVSLRRLGDDRTLVLINGKRAVSNSGNSDRVSVSTIPAGLVERTEITTGGASAIYGSDAIAGVANFLIEDDFEGGLVQMRYETPEASGGEEFRIEGQYGLRFNQDRGYIMVAADYDERQMIRADSTRPLSVANISFDDPSFAANDFFADQPNQPGCRPLPEGNDFHCFLGNRSSFTPGGVFEGGDAWFVDGRWFNDQSLQPADRAGNPDAPNSDFFSDVDGFDFRTGRTLRGSRDIYNVGTYIEYDFTSAMTGSLLALYNQVDTVTAGGFETLNNSDSFGDGQTLGNIAANHPFIPPEVEETRSGSVSFGRRLVELGEQQRINDRETIRLIGDLGGTFDNGFNWEIYGTFGHFEQNQTNPNEYNIQKAQFALDIEADGNGGFQCVNVAARADGCVPLNPFGAGTITQAAADYIRYNGSASQSRTQYSAGGYVSGDVMEFRDRDIQGVFGVEFRREEQETNGDPDGDLIGGLDGDPATPDVDVTTLATFPDLKASFDVIEAFAEVDIPLTDDLSLQAAGRIGDYTTVGAITSYNIGTVWRPSEQFAIRGQYSRSQRAPNLTEFFSLPRPDSDPLFDPCEGLLPNGAYEGSRSFRTDLGPIDPAVVSANCLTEPGVLAYFANPENVDGDGNVLAFDAPGAVQGPNAGNPNLQEETADTFTVGAIFQPAFVENLTFIVDYYKIDISDAITSVTTQNTVDLCYASAGFPDNRFCNVITRNPVDGAVEEVINFQENLNNELVEGVDASLDYNFDVGAVPGRWDLDLRYTHYFKQEVVFEGLGGVELLSTNLGEINNARNEFRASLGWRNDGLRLRYTMVFEEGGVDDLVNDPAYFNERYFELGDETFHRIFASYTFGEDDRFRVFGGVNNIFDNFGPLVPSGLDNGSSLNIVSDLNRLAGREFYAGARVLF
ncbi:TonB-dependent receptor [uncultured Algimonas sp.]|uniref:TonB-dependent receptor plug domain-containing protein n=1 Tax=uncultured Algimonas sp. TaxID=1547920 RepID=UPI00260E6F05|nr:TonB-dependent receptor [uncultured Algimonas sp.]